MTAANTAPRGGSPWAEVTGGEERERLWGLINDLTKGGFERIQKKTEREFPVVVLSPA